MYSLTPHGTPLLFTASIMSIIREFYKRFKVHYWLRKKSGGHVAMPVVNTHRENSKLSEMKDLLLPCFLHRVLSD